MNKEVSESNNEVSRLANFPVSFFSIVMGLTGFAIAIKTATHQSDLNPLAWQVMAAFATLVMLAVSFIYIAKIFMVRHAVIGETRHPIRINFFSTFAISLLLLSVVWREYQVVSLWLMGAGSLLQLCFTIYVVNCWLHHDFFELQHANPSWFIPVVGNIIVPVSSAFHGYVEISWFFFSFGLLFWLVLLTIVLYRLFFHEALPGKMMPTYFILLAPPSLGFIAYTGLTGELDIFARILYYNALFICLLLLAGGSRFIRLPFYISSWAFSFPLAALTIATFKMAALAKLSLLLWVGYGLLILLAIIILTLIWRTLLAIKQASICIPE